jgi:hypothetical protein
VMSRYSSEVYLGRSPDLGEIVRAMVPKIGPVIGATFLYGVVMLIGFLPIIVVSFLAMPVMIGVAFFVAVGWFLYAFARYFAVFQLIAIEDRGVIPAFQRSAVLSRGRKGHILLTLFLVFLIVGVMLLGLALVTTAFGSQIAQLVLQSIFAIAATPLIGISQMLLYYDTRIRAEGYDIEVMTGALEVTNPAGGLAP